MSGDKNTIIPSIELDQRFAKIYHLATILVVTTSFETRCWPGRERGIWRASTGRGRAPKGVGCWRSSRASFPRSSSTRGAQQRGRACAARRTVVSFPVTLCGSPVGAPLQEVLGPGWRHFVTSVWM